MRASASGAQHPDETFRPAPLSDDEAYTAAGERHVIKELGAAIGAAPPAPVFGRGPVCRWRRTTLASVLRLLSVALLVSSSLAHAQDGERGMAEMRTSEKYAAAAAGAQRLEDVRANLQQALNCLVGAQGREYRRSVGDPCSGSSAARELPQSSVNRIRVEKAIRLAAVGVTFHDFDPAHFTAQAVQAVLLEGTR